MPQFTECPRRVALLTAVWNSKTLDFQAHGLLALRAKVWMTRR